MKHLLTRSTNVLSSQHPPLVVQRSIQIHYDGPLVSVSLHTAACFQSSFGVIARFCPDPTGAPLVHNLGPKNHIVIYLHSGSSFCKCGASYSLATPPPPPIQPELDGGRQGGWKTNWIFTHAFILHSLRGGNSSTQTDVIMAAAYADPNNMITILPQFFCSSTYPWPHYHSRGSPDCLAASTAVAESGLSRCLPHELLKWLSWFSEGSTDKEIKIQFDWFAPSHPVEPAANPFNVKLFRRDANSCSNTGLSYQTRIAEVLTLWFSLPIPDAANAWLAGRSVGRSNPFQNMHKLPSVLLKWHYRDRYWERKGSNRMGLCFHKKFITQPEIIRPPPLGLPFKLPFYLINFPQCTQFWFLIIPHENWQFYHHPWPCPCNN